MRVPGAPFAIDRVIQEPNWDTIDMVKHDGHLYSSKPTLLPALMAGRVLADLSVDRHGRSARQALPVGGSCS